MSISSASELELVLIDQAPSQLDRGGGGIKNRRWREGWRWAITEGRRFIEGRLLFEDCFVSESWLSMTILSHLNCPEGYVMVSKDRAGLRIGGGVAMI